MSVFTTIEVASEDFALGEALAAIPGVRIRLERVVPFESAFVPYLCATSDSAEKVEHALRSVTAIESFRVVDTAGDEVLIRVEWTDDLGGLLGLLEDPGVTVLEATGTADGWTMRLRFLDHTGLTDFYRQCSERGIDVNVRNVHESAGSHGGEFGDSLTEKQREMLHTALDEGYFEVPRRINLTELADELDISDSAASQRLRRGIASVLPLSLVAEEWERDSDDE